MITKEEIDNMLKKNNISPELKKALLHKKTILEKDKEIKK